MNLEPRMKKFYEPRKRFNLLIEEALYSEIEARSKQRFLSMTAWITRALIRQLEEDRKYDPR
jgi:hypothetical protein